MAAVFPDEIITFGQVGSPLKEVDVSNELAKLIEAGRLRLPSENALPMLALGAAGGFLGATLLRGTVGIIIGGALAVWAFSQLNK